MRLILNMLQCGKVRYGTPVRHRCRLRTTVYLLPLYPTVPYVFAVPYGTVPYGTFFTGYYSTVRYTVRYRTGRDVP